nr:unnamed protein product [Callosobruchus chinensis]
MKVEEDFMYVVGERRIMKDVKMYTNKL